MNFKCVSNDNREISINWDTVNQYVSRYMAGTPFDVSITRRVRRKSDPLRKYYFAIAMPVFLDTLGYERDEDLLVHRHLKITYFRVKPDERGIYREKDIPSVFSDESDIPVREKLKFVEWVKRKCAEYGGYIPDPNE